jgi:tetratricopeptide (TPR) repeat protein
MGGGSQTRWRAEVERIRAAVLASREAEAMSAVDALLATLQDSRREDLEGVAECHALRGSVLLRQGHHLPAMQAFGAAVARFERLGNTFQHVFALTQLAAAMSSLGLHAQGVQAASAATELALAHGLKREAAQALMGLGLCAVLMGNPFLGERYVLEALGIALPENDERVLTYGTINLVYVITTLADQCVAEGRPDAAEQALARGVRHVHRGDRLGLAEGTFDHALWLSNKAGWLARRGQREDARVMYGRVVDEARQRSWVEIERHAAFGLGRLADEQGDLGAVRQWLTRCVDAGSEHDAYRVVERAHERLALLHADLGEPGPAQRHRVAATLLMRQSEVRRASALQAVNRMDEEVLLALARADQQRLHAELDRLHPTLPASARPATMGGGPWPS